MLEIQALQAAYGQSRVLHDVSFAVGEGEVVTLLGPNGSGKSTLVQHLNLNIEVTLIEPFNVDLVAELVHEG
jgi:ABC-type branched-subunit amino acid transport system ATPase component